MRSPILMSILFILSCLNMYAQTQTVRGKVIDSDTRMLLEGAIVQISPEGKPVLGAYADSRGEFSVPLVPTGRVAVSVRFLGYNERVISGLILSSGKEMVLQIELEPLANSIETVEIVGNQAGDVKNEMALISARSFNVELTERFAGSRGDPARMASNFAGVQGSNDSRNDIVVRGNSPFGVIYRVEGVEIPNPNHFAVAGTGGGPVSILNNKVLSNSDFFTGAFPSEYGNSIAGVFDIGLRNGNNQKHEFTAQLGFLGTELTGEGPIGKSGASYLVNYRYSTLSLFESFKIKIGTSAVPKYQDAAIKLNFPTKTGTISLFAIGGQSDINIIVSNRKQQEAEIYGDKDRDQYFGSNLGIIGVTTVSQYSAKTYGKLTLAVTGSSVYSHHDKVYFNTQFQLDSVKPLLGYRFVQGKQMLSYTINTKLNAHFTWRSGLLADRLTVNLLDSILPANVNMFETRVDATGSSFLLQPFSQLKWKINNQTAVNVGLHGQIFTLNGSTAIEPRVSIQHQLNPKTKLAGGYGYHSQVQPLYIYYHQFKDNQGVVGQHNKNLGFTRSHHFVASAQRSFSLGFTVGTEVYFQSLNHIPVDRFKSSSFSLINQGTGFTRVFPEALQNSGRGRNYGFELTINKNFNKNFYFMITGAVFKSEYQGSDQVWRSTDFDTQYASNFLVGKEWKLNEKSSFGVGSKVTVAGGRRYGPADIQASIDKGELIFADETRNSLQFRPYFRTDLKVNYRLNKSKLSHEIGLDLVNLTGAKNLLTLTYAPNPTNPSANPIQEEYQLGFLPLFYYRIDF